MSFATQPTPTGWLVIDELSGRPVTGERYSSQSAAATARILNEALRAGNLARALGCIEAGEPEGGTVRF